MKTDRQAEVLHALEVLWTKYPHWRFGQLVCNVAGWADANPWDIEDEQLLEAIRKQEEYQKSVSAAGPSAKAV
jgi:hypothetical protein